MTFWYRVLVELVEALESGRTPVGLSGAAALGLFIGLVPGWPLQVWVALLILLLGPFELTLAALAALAGAALGWALDPWLDALGVWLLSLPALQEVWSALYSQPWARLTRFNNSVVLASTLLGLALLLPLDLLLRALLRRYYQRWHAALERLGVLRLLRWGRWLLRWRGGGA